MIDKSMSSPSSSVRDHHQVPAGGLSIGWKKTQTELPRTYHFTPVLFHNLAMEFITGTIATLANQGAP